MQNLIHVRLVRSSYELELLSAIIMLSEAARSVLLSLTRTNEFVILGPKSSNLAAYISNS